MRILRRLIAMVVLTFVLAPLGIAGETFMSPCAPPPGITETPPCAAAPTTDPSLDAGGPTSPPAPSVGDAISIGEIAADLLQSALSLL